MPARLSPRNGPENMALIRNLKIIYLPAFPQELYSDVSAKIPTQPGKGNPFDTETNKNIQDQDLDPVAGSKKTNSNDACNEECDREKQEIPKTSPASLQCHVLHYQPRPYFSYCLCHVNYVKYIDAIPCNM